MPEIGRDCVSFYKKSLLFFDVVENKMDNNNDSKKGTIKRKRKRNHYYNQIKAKATSTAIFYTCLYSREIKNWIYALSLLEQHQHLIDLGQDYAEFLPALMLFACNVEKIYYKSQVQKYNTITQMYDLIIKCGGGIFINYIDRHDGRTPLLEAIFNNSLDVVKLLISHPHLNLNYVNTFNHNHTALSMAINKRNYQMIEILINTIPRLDINIYCLDNVNDAKIHKLFRNGQHVQHVYEASLATLISYYLPSYYFFNFDYPKEILFIICQFLNIEYINYNITIDSAFVMLYNNFRKCKNKYYVVD